MTALDPFALPDRGVILLEASAGTGKTWTIVSLAVRLLIETDLPIQSILVLTFTRAATGELKDRLRRRMAEAQRVLRDDLAAPDEFMRELHRRYAGDVQVLRRLDAALQHYDEASVTTIHGYCQRVLSEQAFATGADLDLELHDDQYVVLREVVENFWREVMANSEPAFAAYLARKWRSPAHLLDAHQHQFRQPIEVLGPSSHAADGDLGRFVTARDELRQRAGAFSELEPIRAAQLTKALASLIPTKVPPIINDAKKLQRSEHAQSVALGRVMQNYCESLKLLLVSFDRRQRALRSALLTSTNERYFTARARLRALSYHDFLVDLNQALRGANGPKLAANLRQRYPIALVDEFQDTDPIQAEIFTQIYATDTADHALYLVGDPKQAIYAFRGADVFAYLRMADLADEKLTLSQNWRSDRPLIAATNQLFETTHKPFGYDNIPFEPVAAARIDEPVLSDFSAPESGFTIWVAPGDMQADRMTVLLTEETASEVSRLMSTDVQLDGRPIQGRDIAVLVRTHKQAAVLRRALARRGVASVSRGGGSVFDSEECGHLIQLLRAVASPRNMALIKGALTTPLFGWSAEEIYELSQSPHAWQAPARHFRELEALWLQFGVARMLLSLLRSQTLQERLLSLSDGQRKLTNYRHLTELLDAHARSANLGQDLQSLIDWTLRQRFQSNPAEDRLLRLETDEDLVSVVTLHACKGLEYPIVFCPFLYRTISISKKAGLAYHDDARENQQVLQLGSPSSREQALARREVESETMRLAYVALTRSRHRTYVVMLEPMPNARKGPFCPVGQLLQSNDETQSFSERMKRFATKTRSSWVRLKEADSPSAKAETRTAPQPPQRSHARFTRELSRRWGVTSFSALKNHADPSGQGQDFDLEPNLTMAPRPSERLEIPGGVRTGIVLHRLLELADFQWERDQLEDFVKRELRSGGHNFLEGEAVTQLLWRVLQTPLGRKLRDIRLCDIGRPSRIDEMGFHFEIERLPHKLAKAYGAAFGRDAAFGSYIHDGYLRGFIDLVFESDGRYYLADYKSNFLGAASADYATEALERVMQDSGYDIQALIYAQALHRLLAVRIPDYRYEDHFGGVLYLFLRGMNPTKHNGHGIYFSRPSIDAIHAFDHRS